MTKGPVAIAKLVILIRSMIIKLHLTVVGRYSEIHLSITVLGGHDLQYQSVSLHLRLLASNMLGLLCQGTGHAGRWISCSLKSWTTPFPKIVVNFPFKFLCLHLFTGIASFHSFFCIHLGYAQCNIESPWNLYKYCTMKISEENMRANTMYRASHPFQYDLLQVLKAVSIEGRSFVELYLPQDFQGQLQWDTMD